MSAPTSGTVRSGPCRAIVAIEVNDAVVYVYGLADHISHDMERARGLGVREEEWTTTVEWVEPPRQSMRYPTDADFARALPSNRQLPPPAPAALDAGATR